MNALNPGLSPALQRLGEVSVRLSVELGRTDMPLRDVLALGEGSVVSLDRLTDELLEITANGQVIAYGEVIAQDGRFALRIVSLAGGDAPSPTPSKPATASQSGAPAPGQTANPGTEAAEPASPASGDANIDELAAALDDTLGEPAGDNAQGEPVTGAQDGEAR
ncbi:FliM/FliN family flagellar motor switch protein [Qipengyuania sp. S6317L1]|uniref:flagellar motor switch protein FliN n=1 Tax=Qipengyuania sp. S6317L1 TaxID=2926410 RepID=UPI001FF1DE0A|nr:flagellar motor switch protein FliN [Qipengyuania sp. S6317L1]MCK0097880.1 FliM/FliN family flagellar motor switch protein [Qipengyuania sp. S6317L1]